MINQETCGVFYLKKLPRKFIDQAQHFYMTTSFSYTYCFVYL